MPPAISVILPVYNARSTIEEALDSLFHQTETDMEILAVENGSQDGTRDILARLKKRDSRLKVFHLPEANLVKALNLGAEKAKGLYLARMDADDFSFPQRLARQREFLDENSEIGLVSCQVEYGGNREEQKGYAYYVDWTNEILTPRQIELHRFVESPLAHPSVCFRRELLWEKGRWRDGPFPEDYELWLRWLEKGVKMEKIPEKLLCWNDPPHRLSRRDSRYSWEAFFRCKAIYLARWLKEKNLDKNPIHIWGSSPTSRRRAQYLIEKGIEVESWIDVDPRKIGHHIRGRKVLGPEEVPPPGESFIISYVASRGAREEIRTRLEEGGYIMGEDFLLAA